MGIFNKIGRFSPCNHYTHISEKKQLVDMPSDQCYKARSLGFIITLFCPCWK